MSTPSFFFVNASRWKWSWLSAYPRPPIVSLIRPIITHPPSKTRRLRDWRGDYHHVCQRLDPLPLCPCARSRMARIRLITHFVKKKSLFREERSGAGRRKERAIPLGGKCSETDIRMAGGRTNVEKRRWTDASIIYPLVHAFIPMSVFAVSIVRRLL